MTEQQPRFQATYQGQVIGWFDTAAQAEAVAEAKKEQAEEESRFYQWLKKERLSY